MHEDNNERHRDGAYHKERIGHRSDDLIPYVDHRRVDERRDYRSERNIPPDQQHYGKNDPVIGKTRHLSGSDGIAERDISAGFVFYNAGKRKL